MPLQMNANHRPSRLLHQIIPTEENAAVFSGELSANLDKPPFSLATMSYNFRQFNARIGVVFEFQAAALRLFAWEKPSHTLSFLSIYTFLCLDPHLIATLPIFFALLAILIPYFLTRHPAPPKGTLSSEQSIGYSAAGPPLAPAATIKPAKELSKDFFHNMRDLQNVMGDFVVAHDAAVETFLPLTNFSDEAVSSSVFLFLFIAAIITTITAHLLPWRFVILVSGWLGVCSLHPGIARLLANIRAELRPILKVQEEQLKEAFDHWVANDVIIDSAPETREVEVFELQKKAGNMWESWVFSPSPFDPLSPARLAGERPRGTRFFEDVKAPDGWQWSEKKWALDLWSREWVEERIITGVEVETEGERWVYDIMPEAEEQTGVLEVPEKAKSPQMSQTTWEEGDDGNGHKGDWRRRRWVRLVKRKVTLADYAS